MAEDYKNEIATYLTADGQVFIAPQYCTAYDAEARDRATCPDFVALDFRHKEVVVVEITAAEDWKPYSAIVSERQKRWFRPIRRRMIRLKVVDESWGIRFLGFVRGENVAKLEAEFAFEPDVTICAIEEAVFLWQYWEERQKSGLPRQS